MNDKALHGDLSRSDKDPRILFNYKGYMACLNKDGSFDIRKKDSETGDILLVKNHGEGYFGLDSLLAHLNTLVKGYTYKGL